MRGKSACLLLAALLLASWPVAAFASLSTRERLAEVERGRQEARLAERGARRLLENAQGEIERILLEMQALDERMLDLYDAFDDIEFSLTFSEMSQEEAEAELEAARSERELFEAVFKAQMRAMQEHGQNRHIELLFAADSIFDFFMRLEHVRTLARFNHDIVERLRGAEARELALVDGLALARGLVLDLQFQHGRAAENIEAAIEERAQWLAGLADSAAYLDFLAEIYEQERLALDREFAALQTQYRAELDELERRRRDAERAARLAGLGTGEFAWPLPGSPPGSRGFGMQLHPVFRQIRMHNGIDISAPSGTPIIAAADGYVRFAGWMGGYGNTVIIDHGGGFSTLYAHNARNRVREGQRVSAGQHIADVGSSGLSTGPHLHFEIRLDNIAEDPMRFF